jgi:uncharacterized protein
LTWEAEDAVIQRAAGAFSDLDVSVEVRNEARVHLWYEEKFGVRCPPYPSTEPAIDSSAATACCIGVRLDGDGHLRLYAPRGCDDLMEMILRPNRALAPREVYEAKAASTGRG